MTDPINPDHYKRLPVEAIEIIEAAIENAPSKRAALLHGQVLRYILRCWNKNGIEDLKKAKWYLDRLIDSFAEQPNLMDGLVAAWEPKNGKANQVYPEPKWTPKIGDWVKIKKTGNLMGWMVDMDKYQGQIVQVEAIDKKAIVYDEWCFAFDWLEPAEAPKATTETSLNSDKIPEGYRKLNDSSEEPRQTGDLRWSVAEKRYIPISGDVLGYANRDNWAACRKVTGEATGEVTGEVKSPDGWRFLERGEVIRKGDMLLRKGLIHDIEPKMLGKSCYKEWMPTIRRNKFEVGEKVVECISDRIGVVQREIGDREYVAEYEIEMLDTKRVRYFFPYRLAPYIEDAK